MLRRAAKTAILSSVHAPYNRSARSSKRESAGGWMLRRRSLYLFPVAVLLMGIAAHPPSQARSEALVSQQESASQQTPATQQTSGAPRFTSGGYTAELPSQFVGNLIFLPVRVNGGQPSLFELASTAAATSMDPERAAELGLTGGSSGG